MKSRYYLYLPLLFIVACSPYKSNLDALGMSSDFSDLEIADDFEAPEDEVMNNDSMTDEIVDLEEVAINLKNTFFFEDRSFALARGPALRWDGCEKEKMSQGGYNSDSKCGRGYFHPSFADNLNEVFFRCVSAAAEVAGYPQPTRVFIRHLGTYNDRTARNSSSLSNHAFARAWDIVNFNMYDKNGKKHKVSTFLRDYRGQQADFYDEFRDCWRESLPKDCRPGKREYKGSVGHKSSKLGGNSLHNDHLHLAYPTCAG